MSAVARYVVSFVLFLSCGSALVANSQTKATKKPEPNTISGRVTLKGKPAPGIVIAVRQFDNNEPNALPYRGATDQEGNYQIANIPSGNFVVTPLAPALVNPDQNFEPGRGKTLLLGEGEVVQGIDFSLVRGAVITGKVVDAEGKPVVEERLMLTSADESDQRARAITIGGGFMTDDRGIYRIYGLPAGRYKISIGVSHEDFSPPPRVGRVVYRRTFYPDVTDPATAKIIEVAEGEEVKNIDISVGSNLPEFTASGRIIEGESGKPLGGVRFGIRRMVNDRQTGPVTGMLIVSNKNGEFRIEHVTPGKYAVFVAPQSNGEVRADPVQFEIVDHDVTDLLLKTIQGFSITGNVVFDSAVDPIAATKLSAMRLRAFVRTETASFGGSQESSIGPDGSFRIGGLPPGTVNFYLSSAERRQPNHFQIVRIERDGVAHNRNIEIKSGENVTGVRIVVSYGTGSLRGEVKILNGPLPSGGYMNVWLRRTGDTERTLRPRNLDSRGHFVIEGIPPGEYELNVSVNLPGVRTPPTTKQMVQIIDGANNVEVAVDIKPGNPTN